MKSGIATKAAPAPSGESGLIWLPSGVTATATALAIPAAAVNDGQFWEIGRCLGRIEQARQWWWGDWWAFAEHIYGSRKAMSEAEGWTGPSFAVCANMASICRAFAETSRRHELLTFSHHVEVARLSEPEADELLAWCEEPIAENRKPRTVRELRAEVAAKTERRRAQPLLITRGPPQPISPVVTEARKARVAVMATTETATISPVICKALDEIDDRLTSALLERNFRATVRHMVAARQAVDNLRKMLLRCAVCAGDEANADG